ncbi:unnamed protein product, partial [Chrysoparadoxa australica]
MVLAEVANLAADHDIFFQGGTIDSTSLFATKNRAAFRPPQVATWNYVTHHMGGQPVAKNEFEKGLRSTKFSKGFQRRPREVIQQDMEWRASDKLRKSASEKHLAKRRERLTQLDKRNQFNVITGQPN